MNLYIVRFFALAAALLFAPPMYAQECSAYDFATDTLPLQRATVVVGPSVFLRDDPNCPDDVKHCATTSYVVRGDSVFTSRTHGAYTCAAFVTARRQTTGWLLTNTLAPAPWPTPVATFAGTWRRVSSSSHESSELRFTRRGSSIIATFEATLAVRPDNVRTGGASGTLKLVPDANGEVLANLASEADEQCRVQLRVAGEWLLVSDGVSPDQNSACGGMGVTLSGIYRLVHR